MNKYEHFAANHFLEKYPEGASFREITALVDQEEDDIVPHGEMYRTFWGGHIADMMIEMAERFEKEFGESNDAKVVD